MAKSGGTGALGTRVLLLCAAAALITAAAGAAAFVLLAAPRGDVAQGTGLERAFSAHNTFQQERLQRLELAARLLAGELTARVRAGAEAEPALVAALAPEWDGTGADEVAEKLRQALPRLGADVALLLAADGSLVARSDGGAPGSLAETPLGPVAAAVEGVAPEPAAGVWEDEGRLFYAARAPVTPDFALAGWAVVGLAVDDVLALEIERAGGADAAFYAASEVGPQPAGASDPAAAERLGGQVGGLGGPSGQLERVLAGGGPVPAVDVGGYRALVAPLDDAAGDPVGAVVLFAPVAAAGRPGVALALAGLGVGALAALLVCAPAAFALARPTGAAARRLVDATEAARAGELPQRTGVGRGPLAGLAASLDRLFSDLHERQALTAVAAAAARGRAAAGPAAVEAEEERVVLVAADLRRFAGGGSASAAETLDRLRRDQRRFAAAAAAHGGRFEGALGHRLLASFAGGDRAVQALRAAAEAAVVLARRDSAFDEGEPAALALAGGRIAAGGAPAGDGTRRVAAGSAFGLLDSLLREAQPGEVVLAPPLVREVEGVLGAAGVAVAERPGMFAPRPLSVLDAAAAARLAGASDATRRELSAGRAEAAAGDPGALGPGDSLGERFEVLEVLASGPEGAVLRARDRELGEVVALEALAPAAVARPEVFTRLDSPLQNVRKLAHPGIARTFDYGRAGGVPFLAREHVPGTPLDRLLEGGGRLPPAAALGLARQLGAALASAHRDGVAHGRLTPERLVLGADGRLRITGFGVAGVLAASPAPAAPGPWPPEGPGGPRGDVYAAASILHRLLAGAWPEPGIPPAADGLPEGLAPLLAAALAPDPSKRPEDGTALAAALDRVRA